MRCETSEYDLSVPRYVLVACLDEGPNTAIIPISPHELKATAEARYNRVNFCRNNLHGIFTPYRP